MDNETRRSKIDALACSLEAAAALFELAAELLRSGRTDLVATSIDNGLKDMDVALDLKAALSL